MTRDEELALLLEILDHEIPLAQLYARWGHTREFDEVMVRRVRRVEQRIGELAAAGRHG